MEGTGRIITVNGIRLNVVIEGNGPDLMLLHGFPDSSYLWRNQIPALVSAGYRVTAPDLRGFGASDAPAGKKQYTFELIISDIISLMDQLGITSASVIGHDWGAHAGWLLAMKHPSRINRYVALSLGHPAAYRSAGPGQMLRSWYAAAFLLPVIPEIVSRAFGWYLFRKVSGNHSETSRWIEDLSRPRRLTAAINWYRANVPRVMRDDFPKVTVPVFGIWSAGDRYLTERQMINSADHVDAPWRYERIEGAGHWIPLDMPDRLNELLIGYLKEPVPK